MFSNDISIHAPHTGRDGARARQGYRGHISIHAPHTGRDVVKPYLLPQKKSFQSTRPIRGATNFFRFLGSCLWYFNPRAPYGARQMLWLRSLLLYLISIHAPHTGRDTAMFGDDPDDLEFQSTRPIRGATWWAGAPQSRRHFNPRAPYGARLDLFPLDDIQVDFNPRAPYGARRISVFGGKRFHLFQSTRPIRGATMRLPLHRRHP